MELAEVKSKFAEDLKSSGDVGANETEHVENTTAVMYGI